MGGLVVTVPHKTRIAALCDRLSKHNPVAKAIDYMFKAERWLAFTRFLEDERVCLTNNAAERSLRGIALGRKSWLFAGSERGGDRGFHVFPNRHREDERCRSSGLARRYPGPAAWHEGFSGAGSAAMELEGLRTSPSGLNRGPRRLAIANK